MSFTPGYALRMYAAASGSSSTATNSRPEASNQRVSAPVPGPISTIGSCPNGVSAP